MSSNRPIRHGEILLVPVDVVPTGKRTEVKECIVGHSETGHHHVLDGVDKMFWQIVSEANELFVELPRPTALKHRKSQEQHRELQVPAGSYRVLRKMEYFGASTTAQGSESSGFEYFPVRD